MQNTWKIYRSHKLVKATPIVQIIGSENYPPVLMAAGSKSDNEVGFDTIQNTALLAYYEVFTPNSEDMARKAQVGDYAVQYEEGYKSVSPKAVFEAGYTEVKDDVVSLSDIIALPDTVPNCYVNIAYVHNDPLVDTKLLNTTTMKLVNETKWDELTKSLRNTVSVELLCVEGGFFTMVDMLKNTNKLCFRYKSLSSEHADSVAVRLLTHKTVSDASESPSPLIHHATFLVL